MEILAEPETRSVSLKVLGWGGGGEEGGGPLRGKYAISAIFLGI